MVGHAQQGVGAGEVLILVVKFGVPQKLSTASVVFLRQCIGTYRGLWRALRQCHPYRRRASWRRGRNGGGVLMEWGLRSDGWKRDTQEAQPWSTTVLYQKKKKKGKKRKTYLKM